MARLATEGIASIMIAALRHFERLRIAFACNPVNEAMFLTDPARPPAGKVAAKRFGLASAFERVTAAFFDKGVQPH